MIIVLSCRDVKEERGEVLERRYWEVGGRIDKARKKGGGRGAGGDESKRKNLGQLKRVLVNNS